MKYLKLSIPAGIKWQGTAYQCSDRWHDGSLMRWDQGAMLPVGGWVSYLDASYSAVRIPDDMVARDAHSWFLNQDSGAAGAGYYLAVATPLRLYVMDGEGAIKELTEGLTLAGSETSFLNKGYGGGKYGFETYGTPRQLEGAVKIPATSWTLDNYGEWLLGVSTTDRNIWLWKPSEDSFAELENSPRCLSIVTTEERFVFALAAEQDGKINVRRVAWCDREDPTTWAASSLNEAGGFELQTDGAIRCGIRVRGRTLILTTTDAHVATYSGPPLVYGFQQVGKNCGVVSDRAVAATGAGAFWMGRDGFYVYDGSSVSELPCEVSDRVFRFLDTNFWHHVYAVANAKFNEIIWFYTGRGQDGVNETVDGNTVIRKVNSRYVAYDYSQGTWSIGEIDRHVGVDSGVFNEPIWLDSENNVFRHEIENAGYGGQRPWAETGPISIDVGDGVIKATQLLSDSFPTNRLTAYFKTRFAPQGDEEVYGPYLVQPKTDVRFTGRQVRMRLEVYREPIKNAKTWTNTITDWDSTFYLWNDSGVRDETYWDEITETWDSEDRLWSLQASDPFDDFEDGESKDVRIGDMRLLITGGGRR